MNEADLLDRHCTELPAGTPVLTPEEVGRYLALLPGWMLAADGKSIRLERRCANFLAAVDFLNRIAAEAEAEGHHPDVRIFSYRNLEVVYWTHSIGGLSENDFIMAARINRLPAG